MDQKLVVKVMHELLRSTLRNVIAHAENSGNTALYQDLGNTGLRFRLGNNVHSRRPAGIRNYYADAILYQNFGHIACFLVMWTIPCLVEKGKI
jgi:hypothetical protein